MANETTKVITGKVRFSFCNVWTPKSINGGDEKYSVSLVISKKDKETIEKINAGIKEAEKVGVAKHGAKFTSGAGFKRPLRDGDIDRSDDDNYATQKPTVVGRGTCQAMRQRSGPHLRIIAKETLKLSSLYGRNLRSIPYPTMSRHFGCSTNRSTTEEF
ncbi:hypothetical protein JCM17380_03580 [Desulfosporosinus burensis]